ncbi:P-loop containing nucleoside triphosphate hydrolase protein [Aureobasidium subglaciale]|nr:P-loop containing nucleoside triphosphate hydrolase protein [Aureobasidium subglaciale]
MAAADPEASYIDYEAFASPDFHAPTFANTLVLSTNDANDTSLDLSTPLSRVLFDVQEVDTHIDSLTTSSALPLLKHTSTRAQASTHVLDTLESQVQGLQQAYTRLHQDVVERYEQAEQVRLAADRLTNTLRLARAVARCLQLGRTLEGSMADTDKPREGHRSLAPAARLVLSLRQTLAPEDVAEARLLARVNAITTLRNELLDPSERSLLGKAQQSVREFSMSTLTGSSGGAGSGFAQHDDTRARTLAALHTLYLLSPVSLPPKSSNIQGATFNPTLLVNALQSYLQTSLTASATSLARALATLPTLDRTLLDISARCQNIVALESLLSTARPPAHPLLPTSADSNTPAPLEPPPAFLGPLLAALDTSSLPSYFWRSLASSLAPRVQEIIARGGVSARTLKTNRDKVRDAVRECVHRGSQLPSSAGSKKVIGNWEREAAVMVGSIIGSLAVRATKWETRAEAVGASTRLPVACSLNLEVAGLKTLETNPTMDSDDDGGDSRRADLEVDQDDEFDSSPRPAKRRRTTTAAPVAKTKKQPAVRKAAATKKPTAKKKAVDESPIVNGEEDAFGPPVAAAKPKRKARVTKKATIKDDESLLGDSDDTIGRSATKTKKNSRKRASTGSGSEDLQDEDDRKVVKPKHRIHVPAMQDLLVDRFADEEPPESSAPWSIRGPIWKKDVLVAKQSPVLQTPARQPSLLKSTLNHSALRRNDDIQNRSKQPRNPPPATNSVAINHPVVYDARPPTAAAATPTVNSDWGDMSDDIDTELLMGLVADRPLQASNLPKNQPFLEDSSGDDFDTEDLIMLEQDVPKAKEVVSYRSPPRSPAPAKVAFLEPVALSRTTAPLQAAIFSRTTAPLRPTAAPVENFADELADLPSDAFDSDDQTPAKNLGGAICISSSPPKVSAARPVSVSKPNLAPPRGGLVQKTLFGGTVVPMGPATQAKKQHAWPLATQREPATHHKLNEEATRTWIYPTNLGTTRDYQFNIVSRGLFHNLLVALPTGLGKTFIAATIMLNWFRWTESAQIVFVAPTKPLVAQQVDACFNIVGIPRSQTVMLTGETSPGLRAEEWKSKRVFFMTPQTIINDLKTGLCDPKRIVLIVVDEAHRATGNYAYVEVIKFVRRFNTSFRVLALTATPGSDVPAVQQVIDGLDISRCEIRTETSLDIRQYVHSRDIDVVKFDYSEEQQLIMELAGNAIRPVLMKLASQNAYWNKDPMKLTAFGCTEARRKWFMTDAGKKAPQAVKGMVNSIFVVLGSLGHSISMLRFHGITPFYNGMVEFRNKVDGGELKGKYGAQIRDDENFTKMMNMMLTWTRNPEFLGHPKLEHLRGVVLNHFLDAEEKAALPGGQPSSTKIMIFAAYRDSAEEIVRVLNRSQPMIRPHVFVGQADSKNSEGMNQKRQLQVIKEFKEGKYNTLVATSIGEEGLDIGEVDLIVCYDASASPIRMLQRMGRTGRKRKGNIVLLLMNEKEVPDFEKAKDNYEKMQGMIASGKDFTFHDDRSPRILPRETLPTVDKRTVEIPVENSQAELPEPKRRGRAPKAPPKKFHMPDNVRTGFVAAGNMDDEDAEELVPRGKGKTKKATAASIKKMFRAPPGIEAVAIPSLDAVYLNRVQERELERKYKYVMDTDGGAPTVGLPRLDRFSDAFPGPTKYIAHGKGSLLASSLMQRLGDMNSEVMQGFKDNFHQSDLEFDVSEMLGDPTVVETSDADLPVIKATKARKAPAQPKVPKAPKAPKEPKVPKATKASKAPKAPRPPKEPPAAKTPKPRGRPKQQVPRRNSSDMEGSDSSPEPTPAHLRLGTQGIDLGSADTSGEEGHSQDDEPDSELDDFVVESDAPIEFASSSQPLAHNRPKKNRLDLFTQEDIAEESEEELPDFGASRKGDVEVLSDANEDVPVRRQLGRRRQVVDDDSDE